MDVTALYMSDFSLRDGYDEGFGQALSWNVDLLSGYSARFMGPRAKKRNLGGFFSLIAPELWGEIRSGKFDAVIIHGHNFLAHQIALIAALSVGSIIFCRGDTRTGLKRPILRQLLHKPLFRIYYRFFDGFLAVGSSNAEYYLNTGVVADRIFPVPFAIDNSRFRQSGVEDLELRQRFQADIQITAATPTIIYAGKLEPRKNPIDLLKAYKSIRERGAMASLLYVGSGIQESHLKRIVEIEKIPDVKFLGFINQAELPSVYSLGDIFVLPSENEPWGLAVNESMACGLAVVCSNEVGSFHDLVRSGVNGKVYPTGDINALSAALYSLVTEPVFLDSCKKNSRSMISEWSFQECAIGLRYALEETSRRKCGVKRL
jgi:glycosyltransferase involved in cell wall biosynthesis